MNSLSEATLESTPLPLALTEMEPDAEPNVEPDSEPDAEQSEPDAEPESIEMEPTSPFVAFSPADRLPLSELEENEKPVLVELLCDPAAVVERLCEAAKLERLVLVGVVSIFCSLAFFAGLMTSMYEPIVMARSALLAAFNTLMGIAAAFGPIYGTSVLLASRLPLSRLVGVLVSAAAAGALVLAAFAPLPYFLLRVDPLWVGPISLIGAFALFGLVAGIRLRRLMLLMAERVALTQDGVLTEHARFRVGVVARMAMVICAFCSALAFWAFDAFSIV